MSNLATIGFIGTGMIAKAMITGFCDLAKDVPYPIVCANRTFGKAKELEEMFPDRVESVLSFQECVDKSDWVVIALLPDAAKDVLGKIKFKPEHKIVSLIFSMGKEEIEPLLNCKVDSVVHMVPGTFVSVTKGPIVQRPPHKEAEEIFGHIGIPVPVESKEDEKVMITLTSTFAPIFSVQDTYINWCRDKGISSDIAVEYITSLFLALSNESRDMTAEDIHRLATVNTPGGINMQAVSSITNSGGFDAFKNALEEIYLRINNS